MSGLLLAQVGLTQDISISQEAIMVQGILKRWAEPKGGTVKILANTSHLWEELPVSTDKPRLLLIYNGESPRGPFESTDQTWRVDRQWMLVVVRGHGFKNEMAEPQGDAIDFYTALEQIRDAVRTILNISQEFPIHYKGMNPLPSVAPSQSASVFMDATAIEWSTAHDITRITINSPNPPITPTQTPMP